MSNFLRNLRIFGFFCTFAADLTVKLMRKLLLLAVIGVLMMGAILTGCNVTRTVTTKSEYFQKGDTACTIITKTIETYDATKH